MALSISLERRLRIRLCDDVQAVCLLYFRRTIDKLKYPIIGLNDFSLNNDAKNKLLMTLQSLTLFSNLLISFNFFCRFFSTKQHRS